MCKELKGGISRCEWKIRPDIQIFCPFRQGLGEQGAPAFLSAEDKASPEYQEKYNANGFNGLLSDKISSKRAVPDIRHPKYALFQHLKGGLVVH